MSIKNKYFALGKKISGKLPQIKKDICDFASSEEGKVNRKDIAKIAFGVLALGAGLSGIIRPDVSKAACGHGDYSNYSNYSNSCPNYDDSYYCD